MGSRMLPRRRGSGQAVEGPAHGLQARPQVERRVVGVVDHAESQHLRPGQRHVALMAAVRTPARRRGPTSRSRAGSTGRPARPRPGTAGPPGGRWRSPRPHQYPCVLPRPALLAAHRPGGGIAGDAGPGPPMTEAGVEVRAVEAFADLLFALDSDEPTGAFYDRLCEAISRLAAMDRVAIFLYDEAVSRVR